ncbi:MAG: DUF3830 family protein [Arenimonas sp.]|nr:DUF3830 family protein [Rhizobium sp.]MBW8444767.1 DUF3830 family protein [Arenimonas sp.]
MPDLLKVSVGPFVFTSRFERQKAPETCRIFETFLPFGNQTIHSRWSGEAVWVPLGDFQFAAGYENHTCHPSRGDILLYPGGYSETELLFAYGSSHFASKMGALAGNHFLTVVDGGEKLEAMGRMVLWQGAQPIRFEAI